MSAKKAIWRMYSAKVLEVLAWVFTANRLALAGGAQLWLDGGIS
jgi:hypothetical protein